MIIGLLKTLNPMGTGNGWYVIKAQTAIGKTEKYSLCIKNSNKRFLIAVPTNDLKLEVYDRAVNMGIDNIIMSPSLHEIKDEIPDDVWDHIQRLYDNGLYRSVNPYIKKVLDKHDIPCLREYLKQKDGFDNSDGHAIITHKRLCNMDEKTLSKYDVIVVDEDIVLKSILPDKKDIPISDLKRYLKKLPDNDIVAKRINTVLNKIKTHSFFELPPIDYEWDKENAADTPTAIDVPAFCLATKFCFRKSSDEPNLDEDCISFFRPINFNDAKYIMLSATADEQICKYYFGKDKVIFDECKEARYKGTLIQYPDKSYSRACIADNPGIIDRIFEWTGDDELITFKKYSKDGAMYLNKTEGIDSMKGKKISIVGTPHSLEFLYKLILYDRGIDFDESAELKSRVITYKNKYKFRFNTYDDEALKNVMFWIISSELEQAVGRARLLREAGGTVHLFSNFPVDQAVFREPEYEKGDK